MFLNYEPVLIEENVSPGRRLQPNRSTWYITRTLPEQHLVTGAYVIAKYKHDLVFVRQKDANRGISVASEHPGYGVDIAGGHVDPGESIEQAAARELHEETGALKIRNLTLIGYEKIEILGPKPEGYAYPYPISYQAFYVAEIDELGPLPPTEDDVLEPVLFSAAGAVANVDWVQRRPQFFSEALRLFAQLERN